MATEKIAFKTTNGKITIERTDTKATITEERQCYGFKEKSTTVVIKVDSTCMHWAFDPEATIKEMYKNN